MLSPAAPGEPQYVPMEPFAVMSEPVRRRIVDVLASGEHTAGQLADVITSEFHITRTAVSKHLRILRDAEFVEVVAVERWRFYHLTPGGITQLEDAVALLREKMRGGVGKDPRGTERDPMYGVPDYGRAPVRKGPGRVPGRGQRGSQTVRYNASDPDPGPPPRRHTAWAGAVPL